MDQYDLLLFDFDGLLVNTEKLHFRAYQEMCLQRGFFLSWSFQEYCSRAHLGSEFLQKAIYEDFPALYQKEPDFKVLYQEKKKAFLKILEEESVELMPGVERLLNELQERKKRCVIVTHSLLELIQAIQKKRPILKIISKIVTREDYKYPKPHPDPYLKALELYRRAGDRVVGFEDTVRGWKSIHAADVQGIVISSCLSPEFKEFLTQEKVIQYQSFEELAFLSSL